MKNTDGSAQESGEDATEDLPDGESVGAEDGHGHDVQMSHRATFPHWEGVQLMAQLTVINGIITYIIYICLSLSVLSYRSYFIPFVSVSCALNVGRCMH